jgi:hypothetical protein
MEWMSAELRDLDKQVYLDAQRAKESGKALVIDD